MKKLRPISLAALALLSGLAATAAQAQERKPYIVQLAGEPVATYAGGVQGYAATRPAAGARLDFQSGDVQAYLSYLGAKQDAVMSLIAGAPITARFNTVANGFAAQLTDAEVLALRANAQVLDVQVDEMRKLDTVSSHRFLGLSLPGGVWSQTGPDGRAIKGEDIIIGVIDSGVWPENPGYADRIDANGKPTFDATGTQVYGPPPASWQGGCVTATGFNPALHCNNKLIGAKAFNATFKEYVTAGLHWTDFADSPRDSVGSPQGHGGHGTHTSTTAGGNAGNPVVQAGVLLGDSSGVAPRARIAAYKVCWTYNEPKATDGTGGANSCFTSDSVSAIDTAVRDGVNVINYSISGSQVTVNDIAEQAFLRAAQAGVFIAASAGNSGPANQVAHLSPWLTTVAASTHDRLVAGDINLGNGSKYIGASVSAALPARPLISSVAAKASGVTDANADLCKIGSLDPAKVSGKIVVCTRGENARVEKSQVVKDAGGAGMIMQDTADSLGGLIAETHSVPTIHVTKADGTAIRSYMTASGGGTAAFSAFYIGTKPAPVMAGFSSRGPNKFDGNLLKPDLTAPGVDVLAGYTPGMSEAEKNQVASGALVPSAPSSSLQGTSMSSPHIAGLGALLKQAHPSWSPMAIKSALMTSAYSTLNDGLAAEQNGMLPWAQGAGHVDPNKAIDPGLVYDSGMADWIKYQCKVNKAVVTPASDCTTVGTLDETYNLNLPSITVANVPTTVTVTRRVTNVGNATATYTASSSVPNFTATVSPSSLTLAPGETKSFTVTATAQPSAVLYAWNFGALSWTDGTHVVKSPLSLRLSKSIVAPDAVAPAVTASGSRLMTIRTGYAGKISANKGGLKEVTMSAPATLTPARISSTTLKTRCVAGVDTGNVKVYNFNVPAGTIVAAFALRQQDVSSAEDDLDIGVLSPDGTTWTYSNADKTNEYAQFVSPVAGNYRVCVAAYTGAATTTFSLGSWIVGPTDTGGKFTVALPGSVYSGGSSTVGFSWSGLESGKRYLAGAQFKDAAGAISAATILRVEPNGVPAAEAPRTPTALELSKLED